RPGRRRLSSQARPRRHHRGRGLFGAHGEDRRGNSNRGLSGETGLTAPQTTVTKIECTQRTWNPIVGCSIVSPGCTNCYAMQMAARIERMNPRLEHYKGLTKRVNGKAVWTGTLALAPGKTLLEPLRTKKPTMWFVNSMSDLFHEDVPDEWIDRVFAVMALTPQHTYQVLTKRSAR